MLEFYKDKKVFVTGHSGFKGTWLCKILSIAGAKVTGYSLKPEDNSFFYVSNVAKEVKSVFANILDFETLQKAFYEAQPEIVFHLAAQPIVKESYREPRLTFETNMMGTVNLLECMRLCDSVKSFLNVTTDKVYEEQNKCEGYKETCSLKGFDPYSNSKSCSELITYSYKNSFFKNRGLGISTARAGNVIGGGDWANDRIIPDCVRAAMVGKDIEIRNPNSIRPYQHVLDPLFAYLLIAEKQFSNPNYSDSYNIGPDIIDCKETSELVTMFVKEWGGGLKWINVPNQSIHEAHALILDCSKMKETFGWKPVWGTEVAIEKTVNFYKSYLQKATMVNLMNSQICDFIKDTDVISR